MGWLCTTRCDFDHLLRGLKTALEAKWYRFFIFFYAKSIKFLNYQHKMNIWLLIPLSCWKRCLVVKVTPTPGDFDRLTKPKPQNPDFFNLGIFLDKFVRQICPQILDPKKIIRLPPFSKYSIKNTKSGTKSPRMTVSNKTPNIDISGK